MDKESKYYQTEESLSFLLNFNTNKQRYFEINFWKNIKTEKCL